MQYKKVGVSGLGQIGGGMARNLIKKGFDVTVYDVREEPLKEFKELGANVADSCKGLASISDVVISVVRDDLDTDEVIRGGNGVWEGIRKESIVIISSTIDPFHCQKLAAEGEGKGVKVLDAPVSGGRAGSEAGALTIMVGGDKAAFEVCRPIFSAVGRNIFYLGKSGAGETFKLVNNLIFALNYASLSEGIALGLKAGLELEPLLDVLRVSSGGIPLVQNWDRMIELKREYCERKYGSALDLLYKDVGLALKVARDLDQFLPMAGLCSQLDMVQFFPGVD